MSSEVVFALAQPRIACSLWRFVPDWREPKLLSSSLPVPSIVARDRDGGKLVFGLIRRQRTASRIITGCETAAWPVPDVQECQTRSSA
jgi:hypothetical protein